MEDMTEGSPPAVRIIKIGIIRTSSIGDVILASCVLDVLKSLTEASMTETDDAASNGGSTGTGHASLPLRFAVSWFGASPSLDIIGQAYPEVRTYQIKGLQGQAAQNLLASVGPLDVIVDLQKNMRSMHLARRFQSAYGAKVFEMDKDGLSRVQLIWEARLRGRRHEVPERSVSPGRLQYENMLEPLFKALGAMLGAGAEAAGRRLGARPNLAGLKQIKTPPHVREMEYGAWVAVAPGAAHETKKAPAALFARVLQMLSKELSYHPNPSQVGFVFLGDEADRKTVIEIISQFVGGARCLNLAGRLSLWESAMLLGHCKVILANDTALAHAAEAVGTPSCVLFGPTIESFGFAPWRPQSMAFSSRLGCRPCSKHGKIPCRFGDKKCFSDILLRPVVHRLFDCVAGPPAAMAVPPGVRPSGLAPRDLRP